MGTFNGCGTTMRKEVGGTGGRRRGAAVRRAAALAALRWAAGAAVATLAVAGIVVGLGMPLSAEAQEAAGTRKAEVAAAMPRTSAHRSPAATDPRRLLADPTAARGGVARAGHRLPAADASARPAPIGRPDAAPAALPVRSLLAGGAVIPYRDVRGGTTPATGAGLWLGADAVDDGGWGYFVGHNPGAFAPVRSLKRGDTVVVRDGAGKTRSYRVRTVLTVGVNATWKTVAPLVTGHGESVILQTCTGDGRTNTIVVAV